MLDRDNTENLVEQANKAIQARTPLNIIGGGSKLFYGRKPVGEVLSTREHRGIVTYEPNELVVTARAGTPLAELEKTLTENAQMLAFEPPYFGPDATLGGTIACNFSGPRRPFAGAARDFVLGTTIINGRGERLRFGGQVMKNVAGYDVSRLLAGSLGTLGVILDVSLKVLPLPAKTLTLVFPHRIDRAIEQMNQWAGLPLPISATCYDGEALYVRLEGAASAVDASRQKLGGEKVDGPEFWRSVREHSHAFFHGDKPLWRIAVPPATPPLALKGPTLLEWNGAQRWLYSELSPSSLREVVSAAGGHATLFQNGDQSGAVFHPLSKGLDALHTRMKLAMDPNQVFNRGRMHP